jgi:5-methyltetrahydrofolate--homocysteine methyltransferase
VDASLAVQSLSQIADDNGRADLKRRQQALRERHERAREAVELLSLTEARERRFRAESYERTLADTGVFTFTPSAEDITRFMDWGPFFWTWGLKGTFPKILEHEKYGVEARKLWADGQEFLACGFREGWWQPRATLGVFAANSRDESVLVQDLQGRSHEIHFTRQQRAHADCLCLADFIQESGEDRIGAFTVTAGRAYSAVAERYTKQNDDYTALMIKALGDRIAESLAEWLHFEFRRRCGSREDFNLTSLLAEEYQGIRPAPGYPACPDHALKRDIWHLLGDSGVTLTENLSMDPGGSVEGFMFHHPRAKYFRVEHIGDDQAARLAEQRGVSAAEVKRWLAFF